MVSLTRTIILENKACSYCEYLHEDDKGVNCNRCFYRSNFKLNAQITEELLILETTLSKKAT